jgi:protein MpaA
VIGQGPDVTLILATIHGDEPAGTPLVQRLADHLAANKQLLDGRRVVIVPVANPDGLAARTRTNSRGVDLNRNYPASNYQHDSQSGAAVLHGTHGDKALSEPESAALHRLIETHRPARIVSLHQPLRWGKACIDYDGPGQALAEAMAATCDLPLVKLGGRPGSLGSYAGETLGTPIITVELPRDATHWSADRLWKQYGNMLLTAISQGRDMR